VALVALLSGIALTHEFQDWYGRHSKSCDPSPTSVFVLLGCLASLPPPVSHVSDPLAPYCYTLSAGALLPSRWHLTAPSPLLAPLLLSGSPRWVAPLPLRIRSGDLLYGRKPRITLRCVMV